MPRVAAVLALLALLAGPAAAGEERPLVVVNFHAKGKLIEEETYAPESLVALVEVALLEHWSPVSEARLVEACRRTDLERRELPYDALSRLAVAREIGATSVFGWAYSFGERVELILEVVDPGKGLPGEVFRTRCTGIDEVPDAIDDLVRKAGLADGRPAPDAAERRDPVEEPLRPGMRDLRTVYARLPVEELLETWPNRAYERLLELRDAGRRWVTEDEYEEAERFLSEAVEHADRLKTDRRYRDEFVVRMNVRVDPVLGELDLHVVSRPPWLLFVEKSEDGSAGAGTKTAGVLERLYDEFHRRFGERLDLPDATSLPRAHERILRVICFRSEGSFRRYQTAIGRPLPPGSAAYYSPRTQWLVTSGASADPRRLQRSSSSEGAARRSSGRIGTSLPACSGSARASPRSSPGASGPTARPGSSPRPGAAASASSGPPAPGSVPTGR